MKNIYSHFIDPFQIAINEKRGTWFLWVDPEPLTPVHETKCRDEFNEIMQINEEKRLDKELHEEKKRRMSLWENMWKK